MIVSSVSTALSTVTFQQVCWLTAAAS